MRMGLPAAMPFGAGYLDARRLSEVQVGNVKQLADEGVDAQVGTRPQANGDDVISVERMAVPPSAGGQTPCCRRIGEDGDETPGSLTDLSLGWSRVGHARGRDPQRRPVKRIRRPRRPRAEHRAAARRK